MNYLKRSLFATCALALLASASEALAEDKPAAVEELIVTAQMRAQQLQDVPISMNIVESKQLNDFNTTDIRGLQNNLPTVFVQTSPTNNGLYLRGFGSSPANPAFDQSVSLYQDGIYAGRTRQFMAPFFDVKRIEVLRGPQGGLLGKNTAAGAISIITQGPTDAFEFGATANYNLTLDGTDTTAYISGPLGGGFSARLAIKITDLDGYFHNDVLGKDVPARSGEFARGSLRYESDGFDVTTKFEYGGSKVDGNTLQYVPQVGYRGLSRTKHAGRPFGLPEYDKQDGYQSSTTANLKLGEFTLTSITGFSMFKSATDTGAVGLNPENFRLDWREKYTQESQELRLISPEGRAFEYILGAYADHSDDRIINGTRYLLFGVLNGQYFTDFRQEAESWSVFGIGTWHVSDELRLLANIRYTEITKKGDFVLSQIFGPPIRGSIPGNRQSRKATEQHTDPAVTIQYDATPDLMVYATYAKGSKAGGYDPTNGAATAANFRFSPEKSTNYEVGAKLNIPRGLLSVAAYQLDFKDLQVASYVPPQGLQTTNAGQARSRGVEATFAWRPMDHLSLQGAAAYLDAKYQDFPGAQCRFQQPLSVCNPAVPQSAPNSQANNNARGVVLNFAPKYSFQIQAEYTKPLGNGLEVAVAVADAYRSGTWVDSAYNPNFGRQPGVHKFDARIEVGAEDKRWALALVGKNITNKITRSYAFGWPLELGPGNVPVAGVVGEEGRTIAIQGTVRFQ